MASRIRFDQQLHATVDLETLEIMRAEQRRLGCSASQFLRYAIRAYAQCGAGLLGPGLAEGEGKGH